MKALPAGLQTHLDSGTTTMCYCWKVIRADGVIQGFTEHDVNLTFEGVTFLASSGLSTSQISQTLGMSVDNLTLEGVLDSDSLNEDDLASGQYDNAQVTLYWVNWQDVSQRIIISRGSVGEVSRYESSFTAEFRSLSHLLNQKVGRTFQRYCDATLGDSRCTVNLSTPTFQANGSITSASGRNLIVSGISGYTTGWFTYGVIQFTSGDNNGFKYEVKAHIDNNIILWKLPYKPVLGSDTFTITAGCAQDTNACKAKFDNLINYQGFSFIPGNDIIQSYPVRGQGNLDGGSLFK